MNQELYDQFLVIVPEKQHIFCQKAGKASMQSEKFSRKGLGRGMEAARQGYIDFAGRKRYTKLDISKWIIESVKG